jgi:hypothetical protein
LAAPACKDLPEEQKLWFTAGGGGDYLKAKRICNTQCPVREACLAKCLEFEETAYERNHIWGGTTASERNAKFGPVSNQAAAA